MIRKGMIESNLLLERSPWKCIGKWVGDGEMVKVSLSGGQVQKWPVVVMGLEVELRACERSSTSKGPGD